MTIKGTIFSGFLRELPNKRVLIIDGGNYAGVDDHGVGWRN
jgi:hypothetical protein